MTDRGPNTIEPSLWRAVVLCTLTGLLMIWSVASARALSAAETDAMLKNGLASAEAAFAAQLPATDAERFLAGGVFFLRAVERAYQTRWRIGVSRSLRMVPFLRQSLPPNPEPEPFTGMVIETLFSDALDDLEKSRAMLQEIGRDADFGVEVDLDSLWFDVNANGARDDGEGVFEVAEEVLTARRRAGEEAAPPDLPVIRFDAADANWLTAYTHVLSATSQLVLAFEPAGDIDRVLGWAARRAELRGDDAAAGRGLLGPDTDVFLDTIAILTQVIEKKPDTARVGAFRDHALAMIAANRAFWTLVEGETDDDREWIPNDRQSSMIPIAFPDGLGARWLAVLDDVEAVFEGRLLVPHPQFAPSAGINLARLLSAAPEVDIVNWIHGGGLIEFVEKGKVIDDQSWRAFSQLVQGQGPLYVIVLN